MHNTLKLTFVALAVSVTLTACKSTNGTRVVEKPKTIQAVETEQETANPTKKENRPAEPAKTVQPSKPATQPNSVEQPKPSEPVVPPTVAEEVKPAVSKVKAVNEDSAGKFWRVIPLSNGGLLSDAGDARREEREHFVLPSGEEALSPFVADEDDKTRNYYLALDLGTSDNKNPFIISLQKSGETYLGKHEGQYKDSKLEGEKIVRIDEDGEAVTQKVDAINYLYINQPYSSYGALYTNENDSNLFHIRLKTGREGQRQTQEGSGSNFAEYGAFTYNNGAAKWNEGLVGDATYKGNVIARVERTENGKTTATAPQLDGDVTLTLHLNNDWSKNKLSGEVNSKTLGTIQLAESTLPDARILRESISFNGEPIVKGNDSFSGYYSTQLVGDKLNDAVGNIELESDNDEGITKYNAVFGGTKQ